MRRSEPGQGNPKRTRRGISSGRGVVTAKAPTSEERAAAFNVQFGNITRAKPEGATRLIFSNAGPSGVRPDSTSWIQSFRHFLEQDEPDHIGLAEVNVNWSQIPQHQQPGEIFKSENLLRYTTAHNTTKETNQGCRRQQGGMMALTMGEMATRLHSQGRDATGLGRWVWHLFRGKDNVHTRIYTAYRPCSTCSSGYSTVYMQQTRHFRNQPRKPGEKPQEP
jgi:hypothetical protein